MPTVDIGFAAADGLSARYAYDANGRLLYTGEAHARNQNKVADRVWRICRFDYDGDGNVIAILYAGADADSFNRVWSLRESYVYG